MADTTKYTSGGRPITAELYPPTAAPNGCVIVIAYGSDGLVDNQHGPWASMMRAYAGDLAAEGFTAMIPDYFQRTGTRPGDIDFDNGGAQLIWLHRNEWQAALADGVTHAKSLPGVTPARTGLLGFSLGGHLCLRIRGEAKALVEFFAPVLDGVGPGSGSAIHAQIHHGLKDQLSFAGNAKPIEEQLKSSGATTELFGYDGATHGFAGADAPNTKARGLAKKRTVAFFKAHI